jgi:hypothetical protein
LSFILLIFQSFDFPVFGSFGMAVLAVNGTGTYGMLRKMLVLSLQSVVIGPFNAEATRTE